MRHRSRFTLLVICLILALAPAVFAQTDDDIALKFFPKSLDDDFAANHAPGTALTRLVKSIRLDLNRSGSDDYLAVAYSNGMSGCLRIIKGTGENAVVVAEASGHDIGGRGTPDLDPVDIENDGNPELVMQFSRTAWIYRYANAIR